GRLGRAAGALPAPRLRRDQPRRADLRALRRADARHRRGRPARSRRRGATRRLTRDVRWPRWPPDDCRTVVSRVGQGTTWTSSPGLRVAKKVAAAPRERWTQPCEDSFRLPSWNASPPWKNTEYGIAAPYTLLTWLRSLNVTWNVPGSVGALDRPLFTGT